MYEYSKYSLGLSILKKGKVYILFIPFLYVFYFMSGNGLLPGLEPSDTGDRRLGIRYRVLGDRESDVYQVFQKFGSCMCVLLY